ncbi:MAG TPA: LCP family protein [Acidimicrobiales bacterium]|nr:LCP family protein [Acidimicrobiales bacterium]
MRVRWGRVALVFGAVIVVLIGAVFAYAEYRNHQISRVAVNGLQAQPPSGVENLVLVGSTSRCELKQQNPVFGLCSQGVNGVNSDVVMILHLDPNRHTAAILSIPRDLFVPNARSTGPNKIDAALAQGPQQLVHAIQQDFGIPIQHYVELNFDSFQGVVNALGGIDMYFPEPVYDAYSQLNVPTAGCRHLNGFQALAVVRARHLQYKGPGVTSNNPRTWPQDPESDLSRIRRDHEFLRVLASAVSKRGLGNPITDNDLVGAVAPQLHVDSTFSLGDMLGLVLTFHGVNAASAPQQTMPVMVDPSLAYYFQGYDYGSVEFASQPNDMQIVQHFLGTSATNDTMSNKALPSRGSIRVSVLNGTGHSGQAGQTSSALQALGYNVVGAGDTRSSSTPSETIVYYNSSNHLAEAEQVMRSLSGAVALGMGPTADGADVTVVTGSNFSVSTPATPRGGSSSSASSQAGTSSTGTSSSGTHASSQLAAPTSSNEPLAPFDPRSCTASGGEGA